MKPSREWLIIIEGSWSGTVNSPVSFSLSSRSRCMTPRWPGSKQGTRYLTLAFNHAGIRAIQYFPVIKAFYQRQRRRKPVVVARAIVAAELARIAYQVLTKREDFNGSFRGVPLQRTKTRQWPRLATPAV